MECLMEFRTEKKEFSKLKSESTMESNITQRLLKNEIIEMADRLEIMEVTLNQNNQMIRVY